LPKLPNILLENKSQLKVTAIAKKWAKGQVTGLRLDYDSINNWNYTVVLDYPQGFCEEFIEEDLAALDELVCSKL
jgi:hypothetical protein